MTAAEQRSLLLLVVLAGVSWYIGNGLLDPPPAEPVKVSQRPVHSLQGLRMAIYADDGSLSRRLNAKSLHGYPNRTTELDAPTLSLIGERQTAWELRADQGWLSDDGELLLLSGPVQIERPASADQPPMRLETRDLRVQPEAKYAETDAPVHAVSLDNELNATGMQAWFGRPGRLKLLADVRARYADF